MSTCFSTSKSCAVASLPLVRERASAAPREEQEELMPGRLQDKVAIVTGAGSSGPGWGNGKATAVLFAREGARVLEVDVNREAVEETCGIIRKEGNLCEPDVADVTDTRQVEGLVRHCLSRLGRIDILHNNVGIAEVGDGVAAGEASWDRVMDVNVKSMFLTCKAVLPHIERQGRGVIVNISSVAGIRRLGVPYSHTRAARLPSSASHSPSRSSMRGKESGPNVSCPG